jgi:hypothetical protein
MITDAPWYVPNMVLWQDLKITSVKEFSYVVLDISIIPQCPTRLITLITTEGH